MDVCGSWGPLPHRRVEQEAETWRRCFLSNFACCCKATVARRKNRLSVRILAICRGGAISRQHSVHPFGCLMLQIWPLYQGGVSAACRRRQLLCLLRGRSHACSAAAGIAPVADTAPHRAEAGAGVAAQVPTGFHCWHLCCCGFFYSTSRNFI